MATPEAPTAARRATVRLLSACNNACAFCAQEGTPARDPVAPDALSAALFAARATADEVTFTGGEPTLYPDLPGAVAAARHAGFRKVGVQTNARRLAQRGYAAALSAAGLTDVHVSLHGAVPAVHDYHTGAEGSFGQTVTGIGAARAARLTVVATTVLTRSNFRSLADLPRLLVARGVVAWQLAVPRAVGRAAARFDPLMPRLALAMPFVLHAVESARSAGLLAWVRGAPLCLLGPWTARAAPDAPRAYGALCAQCPALLHCPGVDPAYLARFAGDELTVRAAVPTEAWRAEDTRGFARMFVGEGLAGLGELPAHVRPVRARVGLPVVG